MGCLLVRRDRLDALERPWFAGGTVTFASVQGDGHRLHGDEAAFEDGTVDYLNLPAVTTGLRHLERRRASTPSTSGSAASRHGCSTRSPGSVTQRASGRRDPGPTDIAQRGGTVTFRCATATGARSTTGGSRSWRAR